MYVGLVLYWISFLLFVYLWYLLIISGLWRHLARVALTTVVVGIYAAPVGARLSSFFILFLRFFLFYVLTPSTVTMLIYCCALATAVLPDSRGSSSAVMRTRELCCW